MSIPIAKVSDARCGKRQQRNGGKPQIYGVSIRNLRTFAGHPAEGHLRGKNRTHLTLRCMTYTDYRARAFEADASGEGENLSI